MKKTFIVLAMVAAISFGLVGCHDSQPRELDSIDGGSSFMIVEERRSYYIVYHKDTKVMYVVSSGYRESSFELMVNADGSPMLYEED